MFSFWQTGFVIHAWPLLVLFTVMLRRSARKRKPTAAVTQVAASAKRKVLRPESNPEADIGQGTRSNPNITTVPQMPITTLGLHVSSQLPTAVVSNQIPPYSAEGFETGNTSLVTSSIYTPVSISHGT